MLPIWNLNFSSIVVKVTLPLCLVDKEKTIFYQFSELGFILACNLEKLEVEVVSWALFLPLLHFEIIPSFFCHVYELFYQLWNLTKFHVIWYLKKVMYHLPEHWSLQHVPLFWTVWIQLGQQCSALKFTWFLWNYASGKSEFV